MVASVNAFPTRLEPLDTLKVDIRPQTGWDKFLDIMLEIVSISLATTRWGDDKLPGQEAARVTKAVKGMLADPTTGPILRSQFQAMRRNQGQYTNSDGASADDTVRDQLSKRITGQNPAEVGQAISLAFKTLYNALDPIAPPPDVNEGFDALSNELSGVLQPRAVARAQSDDFARFADILGQATHPINDDEGIRTGVGLGFEILTLGFGSGALNDVDRTYGPGLLTGAELRTIQTRATNELPAADRRIVGQALQLLVQRGGVLLRDTDSAAVKVTTDNLIGKNALSDTESKAASLLASIMALDLATAGLIPAPHQWLEPLRNSEEEALRAQIAAQLRADLSALPPSMQRMARAALQERVAKIPQAAASPALSQLRLLAK